MEHAKTQTVDGVSPGQASGAGTLGHVGLLHGERADTGHYSLHMNHGDGGHCTNMYKTVLYKKHCTNTAVQRYTDKYCTNTTVPGIHEVLCGHTL